MRRKRAWLGPLLLGAGAGALVGGLIWWFAARRLDQSFELGSEALAARLGMGRQELAQRLVAGRAELQQQMRSQIQTMVPPTVRTTIHQTMAGYGITPETGRQVARVLDRAQGMGLI